MELPLQITLRQMPASPAIEANIRPGLRPVALGDDMHFVEEQGE